jgi:hypothetical protein
VTPQEIFLKVVGKLASAMSVKKQPPSVPAFTLGLPTRMSSENNNTSRPLGACCLAECLGGYNKTVSTKPIHLSTRECTRFESERALQSLPSTLSLLVGYISDSWQTKTFARERRLFGAGVCFTETTRYGRTESELKRGKLAANEGVCAEITPWLFVR